MRRRIHKIMVAGWLAISIVGFNSCADMDVENLNSPDTKRVFENADDLAEVAGSAYRTIINASLTYFSPALGLATMADQLTSSWGGPGIFDLSREPRVQFNNSISYSYNYIHKNYWQSVNYALSQVNDVLIQIGEGAIIVDATTTEMVRAWCYFIQGVAHGHIAMIMQKGFIVDETTNLETLEWKTYIEIGDSALSYLDKCIVACAMNDFILPDSWIRGHIQTSEELAQLANFYAAKFLLSNPRNAAENDAVDWNSVKRYAQNGLNEDFLYYFDGYGIWSHRLMQFSHKEGWFRVDNRIINLMDPDYPSRWNIDGTPPFPQQATSDDARPESDFRWDSQIPFTPMRGYYHFSYYGYYRYPTGIACQSFCLDIAMYPKAENDLMLAEALLRTGDKSGAIAIINAGTRVTRGGLSPLDAGALDEEVLEAIYYERTIELFSHSMGTEFFDMRRRNYLQPGTILHFPIPAIELENLGEAYYTLGGDKGIPGVDYAASDWGWPGWNVYNPY